MKKKSLIIGGIILAVAAVILILKPFSKKEVAASFDTVKVEKGNITNTVTATGTINAVKSVNVGTQVSGILQHVYVDFNDVVRKGQLLAQLDETPLRAQLEQSQSQVDQAQAQLTYQEATFRRLKALYEKNLIAQADYDQALFNYENSKAALTNARSALSRSKVNLDYATITSPIDGVVLNRAVEEGQTVAASFNTPTLFTIVNDLTQMEVQTSVDEADIGKVIDGQRVEFTVDAYPDMEFEGKVSEVRLQPVTTNNVVTYTVILDAPNPDKKLMPGMTASATIFIEEKSNTLLLSGKAIRFKPDTEFLNKQMAEGMKRGDFPGPQAAGAAPAPVPQGMTAPSANMQGMPAGFPDPSAMPGMGEMPAGTKTVWIKEENGTIRPQIITTGIDNGTNVEILSGLKEGDEVVVSMTDASTKAKAKSSDNGPRGPMPFGG